MQIYIHMLVNYLISSINEYRTPEKSLDYTLQQLVMK